MQQSLDSMTRCTTKHRSLIASMHKICREITILWSNDQLIERKHKEQNEIFMEL